MANSYATPGVYIEEISKFPPSVAEVETAIPAFIGYTQKAKKLLDNDLIKKPKRITSLLEYEIYFGGPQPEENIQITIDETQDDQGNITKLLVSGAIDPTKRSKHNMYYSLQIYFANGGGPCYIVSVGLYDATFGTDIKADLLVGGLDAIAEEDEPTLIVFPEAQSISVADYNTLQDTALKQCRDLQDRFLIVDVFDGIGTDVNAAIAEFRGKIRSETEYLKYGAAYYPNLETVYNFSYKDSTVKVKHILTKGNAAPAAGEFEGKTMNATNGATYSRIQSAIDQMPIILPPGAAIAGVYASVDNTRGVWKAPANVSIIGVIKPTVKVTDEIQKSLNIDVTAGKSVNVIRTFTGKGTLVWGARTLAGNDNEWRYVPVRRFFNMVEESVKKASGSFVFEPNDANTWTKVRAMIENFLILQWRAGALAGAKPEQAFYVNVGLGQTMTALDILEGRMVVEIGLAVVRPAEFIILKFSHKMQES